MPEREPKTMILTAPAQRLEKEVRRTIDKERKQIERKLNWKAWLRRRVKSRWLKAILPR